MTTSSTTPITEEAYSDDFLKVDESAGVIRSVRVLGRESKNGRIYSQQALEEAAKLYEDVPVNLDHPDPEKPGVRGIVEGWGVLRDNRVLRDGVYADLHYLTKHKESPMLIERAQRFPKSFGLSHNASGVVVPGDGGGVDIVESIEFVESVDVVSRPATNRGLFESHQRETKMATKPLSKVLEKAKGKEAARLRKLIEMDDFDSMSEQPVAVEDSMSGEDEMKASIESLVVAILRDDSLDAAGKIAKIRQVLNVADKLADEGGSEETSDDSGEGDDEMVTESVTIRLQSLERRDTIRDVLEGLGLTYSAISKVQRKLLAKCDDEAEMQELAESFIPPTDTIPRDKTKPRAKSILESNDPGQTNYEDLKKQALTAR